MSVEYFNAGKEEGEKESLDKIKELEDKLSVAVEALGFISQNASCPHMEDTADKALEKIKAK